MAAGQRPAVGQLGRATDRSNLLQPSDPSRPIKDPNSIHTLPALARRESSMCSTGRRCALSGVDGQASGFAFANPPPARILVHHAPTGSDANAVARSMCRARFRQAGSIALPRFQFSRCLCRQLPERLR